MPRSRIEIYWKTPETAPDGVIAQVRVTDDSGSDYLLPYPCELTEDGWVNAASGKPLAVRVTYWKPYVETLPRRKSGRAWTAGRLGEPPAVRQACRGNQTVLGRLQSGNFARHKKHQPSSMFTVGWSRSVTIVNEVGRTSARAESGRGILRKGEMHSENQSPVAAFLFFSMWSLPWPPWTNCDCDCPPTISTGWCKPPNP